jgi:hypothetical protein
VKDRRCLEVGSRNAEVGNKRRGNDCSRKSDPSSSDRAGLCRGKDAEVGRKGMGIAHSAERSAHGAGRIEYAVRSFNTRGIAQEVMI